MKRIIAFFVLAISLAFSFNAFAVSSPDGFIGAGSGDVMMKVTSHAILPATQAYERMCSSISAMSDYKETSSKRPTNDGLSYPAQKSLPVAGGLRLGFINRKVTSV